MKIKNKFIGTGRPLMVVPVSAKTRSEIVSKMIALAAEGCEAIEWRVDHFEFADEFEEIKNVIREASLFLKHTILIFTYRTQNEGGNGAQDAEAYRNMLLAASQLSDIDFVDLEMAYTNDPKTLTSQIQENGCRVIMSYHNFAETPSEAVIEEKLLTMIDYGADVSKVAVMPNCRKDTFRLLSAAAAVKDSNPKANLLTIAMGKYGAITRLAGESVGSCMTFVTKGSASAPGQMSYSNVEPALNNIHTCFRELAGDQKLFLIGYMGSGKTTIAKKLSVRNGISWVDTDDEIEREYGKKITDIFAEEGEETFRKLETDMLRKLSERSGAIIVSCGGGAILKQENVDIMQSCGEVIHLNASPETIYQRVKHSTNRPLLNGNMNLKFITEMMEQRRPFYENARTAEVVSDEKSADNIASEIEFCFLR